MKYYLIQYGNGTQIIRVKEVKAGRKADTWIIDRWIGGRASWLASTIKSNDSRIIEEISLQSAAKRQIADLMTMRAYVESHPGVLFFWGNKYGDVNKRFTFPNLSQEIYELLEVAV